jgi:hypothetical protein
MSKISSLFSHNGDFDCSEHRRNVKMLMMRFYGTILEVNVSRSISLSAEGGFQAEVVSLHEAEMK